MRAITRFSCPLSLGIAMMSRRNRTIADSHCFARVRIRPLSIVPLPFRLTVRAWGPDSIQPLATGGEHSRAFRTPVHQPMPLIRPLGASAGFSWIGFWPFGPLACARGSDRGRLKCRGPETRPTRNFPVGPILDAGYHWTRAGQDGIHSPLSGGDYRDGKRATPSAEYDSGG